MRGAAVPVWAGAGSAWRGMLEAGGRRTRGRLETAGAWDFKRLMGKR